jgi:hypothetical protein
MTITPKHTKLLTIAATSRGAPTSLYMNEAAELIAAGMLERRETFSAVGARKIQLFLVEG